MVWGLSAASFTSYLLYPNREKNLFPFTFCMSLNSFLLQLLALNFFERMKSTTFLVTYMEAIQYPPLSLLPFYKAFIST